MKISCPVGKFELSLAAGKVKLEVDEPLGGKEEIDVYRIGERVKKNIFVGYPYKSIVCH